MTICPFDSTLRRLPAFALIVFGLVQPPTASGQETFLLGNNLNTTVGVATDAEGDVWVAHTICCFGLAAAEDAVVSQFSPNATLKSRVLLGRAQPLPGLTGGELIGRLRFDPTTGLLWHLAANGFLSKIDAATSRLLETRSIAGLVIDFTRVYDLATLRVDDFSIRINPADSSYGDLDFFVWRDAQGRQIKDVFISGVDKGPSLDIFGRVPFILRVRYVNGVEQSARAVVSTTAESGRQVRFDGVARGVAVNRYGTVLTTLPVIEPSTQAFDAAVAFPFDFPERCEARGLLACDQLFTPGVFAHFTPSRGITTDATGRFHVATGMKGSLLCQNSSGAVLRLSPDLLRFSCRSIGAGLAQDSWDAVVTSAGDTSYVTMTDKVALNNKVIRFRETAAPALSFEPSAIDFGSQPVGTESVSRPLRLTNVGTGPLTITGFTMSGPFRQRSNCPVGAGSLAPGASCTLEVTFAPTATGAVSGTLTSDDNSFLSIRTVRLSATGSTSVPPPTVAVTLPNGGEKLYSGTPVDIQWTSNATSTSRFDVSLSTNGGATFTTIPGCANLSGSLRRCTWAAPAPATTTGRTKVTVRDAVGGTNSDQSNTNFSIATGSGSVTVTTPNTAVNWGVGSTQTVRWSHNLGSGAFVRLEVSRDSGVTWALVSASVRNTSASGGSFNWRVTGPLTAQARIRVSWTGNRALVDASNVDFRIANPFITVAAPSSSATSWGFGTTQRQTWTTNLGPLDRVAIKLSTDQGVTFATTLLASATASTRTASFVVPTLTAAVATARTRVEWTANPTIRGTNPVNFRIERPFVRVTSPNLTTALWTSGTVASITWAHNLGTLERVKVDLSRDGGATYPLVVLASTPSDGSQGVPVQSAWSTGAARVRISWLKNTAISDASDQSFTIR